MWWRDLTIIRGQLNGGTRQCSQVCLLLTFYFVKEKKKKIRSVGGEMSSKPFSLLTLFFVHGGMINSIPTPSRRPLSSNKYIQRIWLPEAAVWVYSQEINSCFFFFLDSFLRSSREPFAAVCYCAIKSRFKRMAISINKRSRGYFFLNRWNRRQISRPFSQHIET